MWVGDTKVPQADQRTFKLPVPKVDHHARERPGEPWPPEAGGPRWLGVRVGSELQVCSKLASNGAQSQYTRPPEMGSASRGQCGSAIVCQWRYGGLQSGSLNRTPPGAVLMQNKGAP